MNEYEEKAVKFCEKYNIKVSIKFKKMGLHFKDDKEERNIYRITIESPINKFSFNFGDSLNNTEKGEKPSVYDVLACITKYDPENFENFCGNYGYEIDSRKAFKVYQAVGKEWDNVSETFTDEALKELQEIN